MAAYGTVFKPCQLQIRRKRLPGSSELLRTRTARLNICGGCSMSAMGQKLPSAGSAPLIRQPQTLRLEQSLGARNIHKWPFPFTAVRTEYLAKNPEAIKRYLEALKNTTLHIAREPDQSAAWFAEALRIDPSVVKSLNGENPLYAAATRDAIRIAIDEPFRAQLPAETCARSRINHYA